MIRIKRNPTDLSIINKLIIVKSKEKFNGAFSDDEVLPKYTIYYDDNEIGYVFLKKNLKEVKQIFIYPQFQRKGVGSYVYNYIENDMGIKLKPSNDQSMKGKLFWKNRSKRKNPTDYKLLDNIFIKKSLIAPGIFEFTKYEVYLRTKPPIRIGYAEVSRNDNYISDVEIEEPYRQRGVNTFLYDYIERDLNITLQPSDCLLEDGKKFWNKRHFRTYRKGKLGT